MCKRLTRHPAKSSGMILLVVLWFVIIITVIVMVLTTETRFSAKIVLANKTGNQVWSDTLTAFNLAEMELFVNWMPEPPDPEKDKIPLSERRNKAYRFNGQPLQLAYSVPKSVTVRIYDHAGKLNLRYLSRQQMRQILEKRLGTEDLEKLDALQDAWEDWIDSDDLKRVKGAEKDYYKKLTPPYEPRNSILEFAEEVLLIKGFAEAFEGVNMEAAFTVYTTSPPGVNPNLATKEALMLLPGLDEASVNMILSQRQGKDFKSLQDFNDIIPPEQLAKLRPWIHFSTSNVFTIAIQAAQKSREEEAGKESVDEGNPEEETPPLSQPPQKQFAYLAVVQNRGMSRLPQVLKVNPYGWLPDIPPTDEKISSPLTSIQGKGE